MEILYNKALDILKDSKSFDFNTSYELASICNKLYPEYEHEGRDVIIRLLDRINEIDESVQVMLNDIVEMYGLYPYIDDSTLKGNALIRYEYHRSPFLENVFLHEEQFDISTALQSEKSVVLSAPTSFGKSLLIEELVASYKYKNIVVIQPTLALLDETRKKLSKYKHNYKILVSTTQEPSTEKGNLFLFTGERVVEYSKFIDVDFFVIDEFYKLSLQREDDRAITLNSALHKLLKFTNKFYMLGPMIKEIPTEFKQKFDLLWFPSDFRTVAVDEISLEISEKLKAKEKEAKKRKELYALLKNLKEPTLIYCSSPNKATKLAMGFVEFVINNELLESSEKDNSEVIEWLNENINSDWFLIEGLKHQTAIHHGAIPRHLGSTIVDFFNDGKIKYLFCTSTLIEGVNTSAKNVVLFDKKKGTKDIDFFDYKNISGRSGRMYNYYIGNVYRFEAKPSQLELNVDIPIFSQDEAPLEILINLDEEELKDSSKERLKQFDNLDEDFKNILKRHSGLSVEGQIKIMKEIQSNVQHYYNLLKWENYPTYQQLQLVLSLCWDNLLKKGENKADIRSASQLAVLTIKYANFKSVKGVIESLLNEEYWIEKYEDKKDRINFLTYYALNITRHWFDYKLPKWLSVISDIQAYVHSNLQMKPGNYSFYASQIENGFLKSNLAALLEYDIPHSAIVKIEKGLRNKDISTEELIVGLQSLSFDRLRKVGLIKYEIDKIRAIN